ncbi:MAG: hypothetical protein AAB358_02925 [Patescibacteria group bacterium]
MLKRICILSLLAFLIAPFVLVSPARAAGDLAVEFEATPLFSDLNFMPGDLVTRWIKVTNNSGEVQKVITDSSNEIDLDHLGDKTILTIKESGNLLWTGALTQFFNAEEIYLSDLTAGATKQYDFTVYFDPLAGNEYQGKTTIFTINIGFQGGEEDDDGTGPIVKAKWEMIGDGQDDSPDAGAQFLPSGQYQVGKTIKVCAIATDPDGVADINGVYGDIFYPEDMALGPNHESGRQGCGQIVSDEFSLRKLSQSDGYNLFCNNIRNNNNNLPTFQEGYDYAEICAEDGELLKDTAYVYCGEKTLSYEDPSGGYRTLVMAQDKLGLSGTLENYFRYLPLTAFETDFTGISYGNVRLNTHKIISGDLTWGGLASIRNIGNTRFKIKVWQDDLGIGKTDGSWNVRYDGRVGSDASFVNYNPEETVVLDNPLNLSQTNEIDFSIEVFKFPPTHEGDSYTGLMVLSAEREAHFTCEP